MKLLDKRLRMRNKQGSGPFFEIKRTTGRSPITVAIGRVDNGAGRRRGCVATTHVNAATSADVVPTRVMMEEGRAGRADRIIKRVSQLAGYSVLAAAYILIMLILF